MNQIHLINRMKKILFFVALALVMSSCSDDVVFNNPSVQGLKDNVFWRALKNKAVLSTDGRVVIEAVTLNENLQLHFPSTQMQEVALDNAATAYVIFESKATSPSLVFSSKVEETSGTISITEYDAVNKTITGTFKFVMRKPVSVGGVAQELYFSQGVFYKVPVSKE